MLAAMIALLGTRALARATLARQLLLDRTDGAVLGTVEHLVGMQAQAPLAPYVGLWSRLSDFHPDQLGTLLSDRRVVRIGLMRGTLHLVSAADALELRPIVASVLERGLRTGSPFGRRLGDLDFDLMLAAARELVEERPRSRADLARALGERWPGHDVEALGYAASYLLPLVQLPPRGVWGAGGPTVWTTVEHWLGRSLQARPSVPRMVLRYLAAFGPATVADMQAWCGLTRLREVTDGLGAKVREFRDEQGACLLDLPDAPRPDPDLPVPPRFLPEYDNVLLSHADRSRFLAAGRLPPLPPGAGASRGTVLVDGRYEADWRVGPRVLHVTPLAPLTRAGRAAVAEEGARLLAFLRPDGDGDVRVAG